MKKNPPSFAGITATLLSVGVLLVNILVDVDEPTWLTFVGLCLLGGSGLFAVPPFFQLKRYGKPNAGDAYFSTTRVVGRGAYSIVRHPQYLGYTLFVVGFSFIDPHPLALVLAGGASVSFYVQSILEERFCSTHLGREYDDYSRSVPRFNFVLGLFHKFRDRMADKKSRTESNNEVDNRA